MKVRIRKTHSGAVLPGYAHGPDEDAGLDICAVCDFVIPARGVDAVPTGLSIELPPGYEAQVRPRSGLTLKARVVANVGTIDPGYRGEIRVVMFNLGDEDYTIRKGDRIAQIVIARYEAVEWEESVDMSAETRRGSLGFGSSGR
jgi:dUTP pyrophosphatase